MIQINYPGSGNYSQFTYDGFGKNVKIVETVSGTISSTKQFVWSGSTRKEARDGSGSIIAQYFSLGQTYNGTSLYYTRDHQGSVRELTSASSAIMMQDNYDLFGRVIQLQGSKTSDLQYAGYYQHTRSSLNLTPNRDYDSGLGRWINRDPIGEAGGKNLYCYVNNSPITMVDELGLNGDSYSYNWMYFPGIGYEFWLDFKGVLWGDLVRGGWLGFWNEWDSAGTHLPGAQGGPQDAYRHCLWSREMATMFSDESAKAIGDNHEESNRLQGGSQNDELMDKCNNAHGRCAAHRGGAGGCPQKCMSLLLDGRLCGPGGMPYGYPNWKPSFGPGF